MLETIICSSPLINLLIGIVFLILAGHREDSQYRCFHVCRTFLLTGFVLSLIFYNKPPLPEITDAGKFTFLFECLMYIGCFLLLYLSRKWFVSMKTSVHVFGICIFTSLIFGILIITSHDLILTSISAIMLMLCGYIMLQGAQSGQETPLGALIYFTVFFICSVLLCGALTVIYEICGDTDYAHLSRYLETASDNGLLFSVSAVYIITFMFLLSLAPLHFCLTENAGNTSLPVFVYMLLVPLPAVWAAFIKFNLVLLPPFAGYFSLFYKAIALLSVVIGAIGACSGQNIRKIFAYGTLFYSGAALLILHEFTPEAINTWYVYFLTYLLATYGICTGLFGLRIKGEYLFVLNEFAGIAAKRPYICALITIFMLSLIGLPPFLGFTGWLIALNYLFVGREFYVICCLLCMLTILLYSYFQIIKSMYFGSAKFQTDRPETGIYITLSAICLAMLVIMVQPDYVVSGFTDIWKEIYK